MRLFIRIVASLLALGVLAYGMLQPEETYTRWLLCLWGATVLFGVAFWAGHPPLPRGVGRSLYNLGVLLALGFTMISLQLLRQQVVRADDLYNFTHIDPESGQITTNIRPVLASQRVVRGRIKDRNGQLLVSRQVMQNGFVQRTYPILDSEYDPGAFANITGFYSTRYGQSGLEATYGEFLSGDKGPGMRLIENNLLGKPQEGNDLVLTLDAKLQAQVYALLASRGRGSVVVVRPSTGEVLAMATSPSFDARGLSFNYSTPDWNLENQRISDYWSLLNSDGAGQPMLNRPTQGQYPPGSTFKTLTAIGVLEYPERGDPNNIRCLNELPTEVGAPPVVNAVDNLAALTGDPSNLERVYAYSCNVAFAQYALRLGAEVFEAQAAQFDFYRPQDAPPRYTRFTDLATAPSRLYVQEDFLTRPAALADTGYGQGQLLVTPLQMAMMTAAVGNDGILMQPYLVAQVVQPDGTLLKQQSPTVIRRTMKSETATAMLKNMRAVADYGFGNVISSYLPGISVGGKSGTGEHVPGAVPHAWFIALAPLEAPRYAVAVMVESGGEGSSVGASLAGEVLAAAFALEQ